MDILLLRHGNTFEAGQTAVWVGGRTDLPLVEKGREQADNAGTALSRAFPQLDLIISGPLQRTRETALIVAKHFDYPPEKIVIDPRLREIDYGLWEGKSSEQIRAMSGAAELEAWEKNSKWPEGAGWSSSLAEQTEKLQQFMTDVANRNIGSALVVSSNGIFKLLGKWIDPSRADVKMATGHISLLRSSASEFTIKGWNLAPSKLEN